MIPRHFLALIKRAMNAITRVTLYHLLFLFPLFKYTVIFTRDFSTYSKRSSSTTICIYKVQLVCVPHLAHSQKETTILIHLWALWFTKKKHCNNKCGDIQEKFQKYLTNSKFKKNGSFDCTVFLFHSKMIVRSIYSISGRRDAETCMSRRWMDA